LEGQRRQGQRREYYKKNAEFVKEQARKYYSTHREAERERARRYGAAHPGQHTVYPHKQRARELLRSAVVRQNVVKPTKCEECGWEGILHGHHTDYSKPFEVRWLCSICHGIVHRKQSVERRD
jgi:predicted Zn-ribbon and HTH transcriptional regulator